MHTVDVPQIYVSYSGRFSKSAKSSSLGLWQHTAIKVVAVYTAIGFVVTEILLFAVWCRPFHLVRSLLLLAGIR